jgi:hypothetical protein
MSCLDSMEQSEHGIEFGRSSCEMIARNLRVLMSYDFNPSAIEVWEDDENGARIEWD